MNSSTVFKVYAPQYAACGLRTIPVSREKTPLVKNWQKFGVDTYKKLLPKFSSANLAVLDGTHNGITRVDVDDPTLIQECMDRFGETSVVIRTPSGGVHLCYRANGEGRQIKLDGKDIDILGSGGFGLMPPSETDKGRYEFIEGSIDHLRGDLPIIQGLELPSGTPLHLTQLKEGDGRNKALFCAVKDRALVCQSEAEVRFIADQINSAFAEPLSEREVGRVVGSIWRYKVENRLLAKGCEATVMIPRSIFEKLTPYELVLYAGLKLEHGANNGKPFVLAQSTAQKFGMAIGTLRKSQRGLQKKGLLEIVQAGEQGKRKWTIVRLPPVVR